MGDTVPSNSSVANGLFLILKYVYIGNIEYKNNNKIVIEDITEKMADPYDSNYLGHQFFFGQFGDIKKVKIVRHNATINAVITYYSKDAISSLRTVTSLYLAEKA